MGYYLSRTMMAGNMLLRAESNVDKKELNILWAEKLNQNRFKGKKRAEEKC